MPGLFLLTRPLFLLLARALFGTALHLLLLLANLLFLARPLFLQLPGPLLLLPACLFLLLAPHLFLLLTAAILFRFAARLLLPRAGLLHLAGAGRFQFTLPLRLLLPRLLRLQPRRVLLLLADLFHPAAAAVLFGLVASLLLALADLLLLLAQRFLLLQPAIRRLRPTARRRALPQSLRLLLASGFFHPGLALARLHTPVVVCAPRVADDGPLKRASFLIRFPRSHHLGLRRSSLHGLPGNSGSLAIASPGHASPAALLFRSGPGFIQRDAGPSRTRFPQALRGLPLTLHQRGHPGHGLRPRLARCIGIFFACWTDRRRRGGLARLRAQGFPPHRLLPPPGFRHLPLLL